MVVAAPGVESIAAGAEVAAEDDNINDDAPREGARLRAFGAPTPPHRHPSPEKKFPPHYLLMRFHAFFFSKPASRKLATWKQNFRQPQQLCFTVLKYKNTTLCL